RRGAPFSIARWGCATPGGRSRKPAADLLRAGLDGLGGGEALGRREDGEIAVGGGEEREVELAIADGRQLAAKPRRGRAVTLGRLLRIDDPHPGARGERRPQAVEELVGILDLVIHVREDRYVHGVGRQLWIPRLTQDDVHALDSLLPQARLEPVEEFA